jgi:SAM-dependent methyltransferase
VEGPKADRWALRSGERQVAETLDGIDDRHRARYEWAQKRLPAGCPVLDIGCGCGYGAAILAGHPYLGADASPEAIGFANANYGREGAAFVNIDLSEGVPLFPIGTPGDVACIALEVLEHLPRPSDLLGYIGRPARPGMILLVSVPVGGTRAVDHPFHEHDFTKASLAELLERSGFAVDGVWCQHIDGRIDRKEDGEKMLSLLVKARRQADGTATKS